MCVVTRWGVKYAGMYVVRCGVVVCWSCGRARSSQCSKTLKCDILGECVRAAKCSSVTEHERMVVW